VPGLESEAVSTLVADPPSPAQEGAADGAPRDAHAPQAAVAARARACPRCGAEMAPGQDWCLHCGTGVPGSLSGGGWRPAAAVLGVTALLVLAAAGAGYAALRSKRSHAALVTRTVAQVTPAPAVPAPATTPAPAAPAPVAPVKPPTVAQQPPAPAPPAVAPAAPTPAPPAAQAEKPAAAGQGASTTGSEAPKPEPILLDTNAASTYNPENLPAGSFGDPSLAIDGDTSTGWTAAVEAANAPNLAVGLLIDLRSSQRVSSARLVTTTPGMTVQVYGATGKTVPTSITDPAWAQLTHAVVIHKRHAKLTLQHQKSSYRYIALWVSKAPSSSTAAAPGRITVNEIELLPGG